MERLAKIECQDRLLPIIMGLLMLMGVSQEAKAFLPASIIELPENAVLVEKKSQTLIIYSSTQNQIVEERQMACSTGEVNGIKEKEGDKKTPEGIYFLADEYENKDLSPIYGKKAFSTDYPNLIDQQTGKNGSNIWIHGTNKPLKPMDSNGCVVLENHNILELADYIHLYATPVIIVQEIQKGDPAKKNLQKKTLHAIVGKWQKAIESGTYQEYLSFYSPQYLPEIDWWKEWMKIRKASKAAGRKIEITNQHAGIYYHNTIFVMMFDQMLSANEKTIYFGKRKLFLSVEKDIHRIIGDTFQYIPDALKSGKSSIVSAGHALVHKIKEESVIETVKRWLAAWSDKDMETYASFYATNFHSDGMNKEKWVRRKKMLAAKYDYINVAGSQFNVEQGRNFWEVTFFQAYKSSGHSAQGIKRLKLVDKGGIWKIYREIWRRK